MLQFRKYVLFDLDGTLTDSEPGIIHSVLYTLERFGIQEKCPASLRRLIGPPLDESFQRFYGMTVPESKRALEIYREYFSDRGIYENAVYPGIPNLLSRLKGAGKELLLATSKPEVFAARILKHFGLAPYFSVICGCELDGRRSAKCDVIREALRRAGEPDPLFAVMVGDRIHDLEGARANGIPCVAVGYGYGSREELAMADAYAETVDALAAILLG